MFGNGAAGASYGDLLITSLVVLAGVCVAAFVVVRLAGRWLAAARSGGGGDVMAVVARLPLEPRRSLYVVEVAGKTLLVGTSEMGLSLLSELDGAAVQARAAARPKFGELVRSAWLRRRGLRASRLGDGAVGAEVGADVHDGAVGTAVDAVGTAVDPDLRDEPASVAVGDKVAVVRAAVDRRATEAR